MTFFTALISRQAETNCACESLRSTLSRIPELIAQSWFQEHEELCDEHLPPSPASNKFLLHLLSVSSAEGMSLPRARQANLEQSLSEADILHLSNLHGDSLALPLLGKLRQPILYDVGNDTPLTALCHECGDCKQYLYSCRQCPRCRYPRIVERIFQYKQRRFADISHLILITPSHMRQHELRRSPMFQGREVRHIGIAVDCDKLHHHHRIDCKEERDIHPHQRVIAFRCSQHREDWLERERDIIQSLCLQLFLEGYHGIHILILGQSAHPALAYPCSCHAITDKEARSRARLYSSIDILVHLSTSKEDERHALEAMACKLPTITHRQGNMGEYVEHRERGCSIRGKQELHLKEMLEEIKKLLHAPILRTHYGLRARTYIEQEHDANFIAELYRQLYHEQINRANRGVHATGGTGGA